MRGHMFLLAGLMCLFALHAQGQEATNEDFTVARVTHFDAPTGIVVLTATTLKELTKEVALDNRALDKAWDNVRKEWREKHSTNTVSRTATTPSRLNTAQGQQTVKAKVTMASFPLKRPPLRRITVLATLSTEAAANAMKKTCDEEDAAKAKQAADDAERKAKQISDEAERQAKQASDAAERQAKQAAKEAELTKLPDSGVPKRKDYGGRAARESVKATQEAADKEKKESDIKEWTERLMSEIASVKADFGTSNAEEGLKGSGGRTNAVRKIRRMGE